MTAIENIITKPNLIFAEFKAFQDLSHKDIAQLFSCTIQDSINWSKDNAPAEIDRIAMIANKVAEKARLRGMSDTDIQYFEKQKDELEAKIADYVTRNHMLRNNNASLETILTQLIYMSFIDKLVFLFAPKKTRKSVNALRNAIDAEFKFNWFD